MEAPGTADTLLANVATLAEGPRWETRTQRLLWVDIEGRALHEYDPGTDMDRAIPLPAKVGAAAATQDPGQVLVALADRLARVDLETGDVEPLAEFPHAREDMRANDGDVDPAGRFWIGTMCEDEAPDLAALYRYDPDGSLTPVLQPVSLSNGLGWAAGEQRMYYIDSPTKRIDVLDYDAATGEVADRRPFAVIEDGVGVPDGLALDVEDGVWVALYGGGQVRRYGPGGALDAVLEIPADNVTACAFGGEDGRRLFVTTARSPQPLGGSLFTAEPGIAGPPARAFGGFA
ncbi:MAG: SMP-30/gluconolactonase/LRE family protein [Solirubrobacteraceae bacterium]